MSRVCFLISDMSWSGGTVRMTQLISNELCCDNDVFVLSLHKQNEISAELDNRIIQQILPEFSGKFAIFHQIHSIHKFIIDNKIDCLINVDIGMGIYGIPASWGTKAKVFTWEHGNFYNNWGSRLFPYFRKFAAKHSDKIIVLTEKDKNNYLSNIKRCVPVEVIPNPMQKHNFNYDINSKTILSAGLLLPIKRFDLAIEAASKVLPSHPDWKWVICGEGPEREKLETLIKEKGLQNQFFLLGKVSNMDEQYQNAAMYVMTSEMEGLPMVLLEAQSWGLPIVSFDIMTGPSDIVTNDENGFLVESYDSTKIAEKASTLIERIDLRKQFSERSQIGSEKFDIKTIISNWQEIIGNG